MAQKLHKPVPVTYDGQPGNLPPPLLNEGKQQKAQPAQRVYVLPAVTGIITYAYAPVEPNGDPPQQHPAPLPPPAPQIWNLALVIPAGTVHAQQKPQLN